MIEEKAPVPGKSLTWTRSVGAAAWYWYNDLRSGSGESRKRVPSPDDENPLAKVTATPIVGKDFVGGAALLRF